MVAVANWIVAGLAAYALVGILFAIPFVLRGINGIDPLAAKGSWGFRLIILPGVVAFWPLLARRWMTGAQPRTERNPHRDAACKSAR